MKEFFLNIPWSINYFGNSLKDYVIFLGIFLGFSLLVFILKIVLLKKVSRIVRKRRGFRVLLDIIDKIRSPFFIYISFYIALSVLDVPSLFLKVSYFILIFWVFYRVMLAGSQVIDFFALKYLEKQIEKENKAMIRTMGSIVKGILWVFGGLVVLSLLGINITAIVAGMGVGGIAIAFALQNILSDLFSSFSIYFDKPFIEGDFIVVGEKSGTVEKIGIKSTRVRALQGEEIIFSNKELTSAQVHNLRRMEKRRALFKLGIVYETSLKKMEKIPSVLEKIVQKEELAEFDRANFCNFNDFSLDYELVYFVKSADYITFMDVNEKILFAIKQEFEKEKIEFAYPTRKVIS